MRGRGKKGVVKVPVVKVDTLTPQQCRLVQYHGTRLITALVSRQEFIAQVTSLTISQTYRPCICNNRPWPCICNNRHWPCICNNRHWLCICNNRHWLCICNNRHRRCICNNKYIISSLQILSQSTEASLSDDLYDLFHNLVQECLCYVTKVARTTGTEGATPTGKFWRALLSKVRLLYIKKPPIQCSLRILNIWVLICRNIKYFVVWTNPKVILFWKCLKCFLVILPVSQ